MCGVLNFFKSVTEAKFELSKLSKVTLLRLMPSTGHPPLSELGCVPPQYTPFLGLNFKVGKMNYHLGNWDPNWAKKLKSGKPLLEAGKKKLFMMSNRLCGGKLETSSYASGPTSGPTKQKLRKSRFFKRFGSGSFVL